MTVKHKSGLKYVFGALIVLYPVLIFSALVIFKISIRYLSIFLIALAIGYYFINRSNYHGRHKSAVFITPAIIFTIGVVSFCLPFFFKSTSFSEHLLKIYPALADAVYLTIFLTSYFIPPTLIEDFVNLIDKNVKINIDNAQLQSFCKKSTIAWCVFFFFDAVMAVVTTMFASDLVWGIYNSGITYVLMGIIFVVQYVSIKITEKRILAKTSSETKNGENAA
jgi:uncharacterized membrane protein